VPTTWVAGRPAARAVTVLERLQPPGQMLLFARLPYREGTRPGSAAAVLTTAATQQALADFTAWVNGYCAATGRTDTIPAASGPLTTRQFRRSLAWHIARLPGGVIAGALQYRHHAIQMFESYAGTSASGFRAEVEAEQALTRGEHLLAMTDQHQHQHHQLTGPAAAEAAARLRAFAGFAGQVSTDPRRIARLMASHDPAIYPGEYVTCIYSHPPGTVRPQRRSRSRRLPAAALPQRRLHPRQPRRSPHRARQHRCQPHPGARPAALPPAHPHQPPAGHHRPPRPAAGARMTRKINLPAEEHVRAVMTGMLADADAGGPRPTVLALARSLGLANATFWRHYHDIATELRQHAVSEIPAARVRDHNRLPGQGGELASQNAALRRERDHLASQLEAALSHPRRLTIDNAGLRRELEIARAVTRLDRPGAPGNSGGLVSGNSAAVTARRRRRW
jgi:hypothetical protein